MSASYSEVVETARHYYNSDDADNFYFHVWGGEDIHIGLYEGPQDTIAEASRRTVERIVRLACNLGSSSRVLDVGAGYGGAARYLAGRYGCRVVALNLSEKERRLPAGRPRPGDEIGSIVYQAHIQRGFASDRRA